MFFESRVTLLPNLFYSRTIERKEHFFYPVRTLAPEESFCAAPYPLAETVCTNFTVRAVGVGSPPESSADIVGFLFRSNLPVVNYRTAIMSYAKAWQQNAKKVAVIGDELVLALKDEHFLMFHAPGKATLVTSLTLSEGLHEYLTMI